MYPYAHVRNGAIIERRSFPDPLDPAKIKHVGGEPAWRPVVVQGDAYDPATQVRTGPTTTIEPTQVVDQYTVAPRDAAEIEAELCAKIDQEAEAVRQAFITPGDGQALVYEKKAEEARAWQATAAAGGNPGPADTDAAGRPLYPFLKARAERLDPVAPDYQAVADEWTGRSNSWVTTAAAIEDAREGGKEAVASALAATPPDPASALAAVDTALATLRAIAAQVP